LGAKQDVDLVLLAHDQVFERKTARRAQPLARLLRPPGRDTEKVKSSGSWLEITGTRSQRDKR